MATFNKDSFEGVGYEYGNWSEVVDSGCSLDPDKETPSPPSEGGSQQLECIVADQTDNDAYIYEDKTSKPIIYAGEFVYINALPTLDLIYPVLAVGAAGLLMVIKIDITNASGTLKARLTYYNDGSLASTAWVTISVQSWTRFEFQYDTTNELWGWKIDGVIQHSGALTGSLLTPRYVIAGIYHGADTAGATVFVDLVKFDDSEWPFDFIRSVDDSIGITDALSIIGTYKRLIEETGGITDILTKVKGLFRSLDDSVGIGDTSSIIGTYKRLLDDSEGIGDVLVRVKGLFRSLDDSVGITDTLARAAGFIRLIENEEGISDTLSIIGTYKRLIEDTENIAEALTEIAGFFRSLGDTVSITEILSKIGTYKRLIENIESTADVSAIIGTYKRLLDDSVGMGDTLTKVAGYIRLLEDIESVTDSLDNNILFVRNIEDVEAATDVLSKLGIYIRTIETVGGISDFLSKIGTYKRSVDDSIGITSVMLRIKGGIRSILDAVGITDMISKSKWVTDSFKLSTIVKSKAVGRPVITRSDRIRKPNIVGK